MRGCVRLVKGLINDAGSCSAAMAEDVVVDCRPITAFDAGEV